ncbi:hypothetical protein L1887_23833 [Cichorium endivia]|nr:hypothetical protein L1887_23833 [Cichorium endivia]
MDHTYDTSLQQSPPHMSLPQPSNRHSLPMSSPNFSHVLHNRLSGDMVFFQSTNPKTHVTESVDQQDDDLHITPLQLNDDDDDSLDDNALMSVKECSEDNSVVCFTRGKLYKTKASTKSHHYFRILSEDFDKIISSFPFTSILIPPHLLKKGISIRSVGPTSSTTVTTTMVTTPSCVVVDKGKGISEELRKKETKKQVENEQ